MKNFLFVVVAMGLALTACEKKDQTTTEPAKATEAAKPAQPTAVAAVPAAATAPTADLGNAPEYIQAMVKHIGEINKLTKDNMTDCAKAAAVITTYVNDNEKSLSAMATAQKDAEAKMTDADKMKMGQQLMAAMTPIMQETMKVQMEFAQKCPNEAKTVGEAMNKFKK